MSLKTWALVAATCVAVGCSDDETSTPSSTPDSGTQRSAYERLGGKDGVRTFVTAQVTEITSDPDLKTYFFKQAPPEPAGSPSAKQIIECFSRLVASVLQAEEYPGAAVNDAANANTPNFTCRTEFKAMHAGLRIGGGTFDKFVGIIAKNLMPLVQNGTITQAEFDTLAGALTGTKTSIVDPAAPAGPAPFTAAQ